ncbi:uncharacterized protein LOC120341821 [Styela clava]
MSGTETGNCDEEEREICDQVDSHEPKKKKKVYKLCNWIRGAVLFCFCCFRNPKDEKNADSTSMTLVESIDAVELGRTPNYEKTAALKKPSKASGDNDNKYPGLPMMPAEKTQSFENIPGAVFDEKELVVSKVEGKIRLRRPKTAPVNRTDPATRYFPPVAFWTPVDIKQSDIYKIDRNLPNLKLHIQTCIKSRRNKTRFLKPLELTPTGRKYGTEDNVRKMRPKTAPPTRKGNADFPSLAFWAPFDIKRCDLNNINRNLPSLQDYARARPKSRRNKRKRRKRKLPSDEDCKV